ncbi:DUF2306 domain-containing protein [Brevibacillus migulae]|uniref:DUF2306 domain-containing protein n=1 Tax=Brevibacillus migulae TaxID=1644114 RepID=UPI001F1B402A|nr:DUF2306 domain-containing protein [Brevibacillus migulae]
MKSGKGFMITLFIISFLWFMHTLSKNFMIDPDFHRFLSNKDQALSNPTLWILMIRIHIILALIALLTGPIGLIKRLRVKSPFLHRWNGRIYFYSILLNFIPGMYAAFFASGGIFSTIGFIVLDTLWLVTTMLGVTWIKKKDIQRHSTWMIRSFFLTFANMTIYLIVAATHHGLHLPYGTSYTIAVWTCWVINLGLAEIVIRKKAL